MHPDSVTLGRSWYSWAVECAKHACVNDICLFFSSYIILTFTVKRNGIPLSATFLYLKNVLYWPEDDRLRSKHVAVM